MVFENQEKEKSEVICMSEQEIKPDWTDKVKKFMNIFSREVKRTKEMGAQMLSASRVNSELNFTFQELGKSLCEALKTAQLKWDKPEVIELVKKVEELQEKLKALEEELDKLKKEGKQDQA
jgi:mevalonate kinase